MPLPKDYAGRKDWASANEQGMLQSRNMFQLDGTGLFLATVLVLFVLYKQAYLRWEERKTHSFIARKLASKDGEKVTMVALVSDQMSLVRHSRVIQAVNRVPGVAISALAGVGTDIASDRVIHKQMEGKDKAAAARTASVGDSDDSQMREAHSLAKKHAVPVVRSSLAQVTCDPSINAVVLFLSSAISETEAARAVLMSVEAGKHVICAGPGGAKALSSSSTIKQVRAAIALAGRGGSSATTPVLYPASPYRFHPLYHRIRARLRMVAPVKRINVDVRFPVWQGAMLTLVTRVPFSLNFIPYRFYASAWAMYSDTAAACFATDVARQLAVTACGSDIALTEGLRNVTTASGAASAGVVKTSKVTRGAAKEGLLSSGVRAQKWECGKVTSNDDGLQVSLTTGSSGLWFASSTVTAMGEHGTLRCDNLDSPSTGHKLVVEHDRIGRSVEYAYGLGASAFEYQMMSFARAVRDGAKDEDAQHFEDFAAVTALLETASSDDAKRE